MQKESSSARGTEFIRPGSIGCTERKGNFINVAPEGRSSVRRLNKKRFYFLVLLCIAGSGTGIVNAAYQFVCGGKLTAEPAPPAAKNGKPVNSSESKSTAPGAVEESNYTRLLTLSKRVGLWKLPDPVPPWNSRQGSEPNRTRG